MSDEIMETVDEAVTETVATETTQAKTFSQEELDRIVADRIMETVGKSLRHSCRSELTRQGISLP